MDLKYKNGNIHYAVNGKGPAVILLHGFLESITMWEDVIPELSKAHQVVRVDLLGHGHTDCLGYLHTMEDMADAVVAVLEYLNIKDAHFIGHSMGGYVALALAEKYPKLFKGICLMNSTFEADNKERKLVRTRANKMAQNSFKTLVRTSFTNLFAPESIERFKSEYEHALQLALHTPIQGYIAAQEGMKLRSDKFKVLNSLETKKLIIIGKKDAVVDGNKLITKIENTTIDYVELSEGHMSHIENKSELSYFLKLFIEK